MIFNNVRCAHCKSLIHTSKSCPQRRPDELPKTDDELLDQQLMDIGIYGGNIVPPAEELRARIIDLIHTREAKIPFVRITQDASNHAAIHVNGVRVYPAERPQ
ncbi:hypothetical protein [Mycobacteroides abscessus]|uniref:hypothetical protein n=1 Tax=Mycobacteroides abscessus TaxID=36809 RepID=UPI00092C5C98|nr:hypothetical protein [Mycobacteroides abscessus]SIC59385.1 Uncharacterised protein [Mycobacteroides abscessus subsp. abscessus]